MIDRKKLPNANRLSAAIVAAMLGAFALPQLALAQDSANQGTQQAQDDEDSADKAQEMEKVVVTGSLIPQSQIETFPR
jgi:hypothetical protein